MPGRKPTPTAIKELNGNPGKRPLNKAEPQPRKRRPKAPAHLSEVGLREWRRVLRILWPMGVVTEAEGDLLGVYVSAYERWLVALEALRPHIDDDGFVRGGILITNAEGVPMRNPALKVANDEERTLLRCMAELGLTPSARARLTAPVMEDDPLEAFLRGTR